MRSNLSIKLIQQILKFYKTECWILFTDEAFDPYFKKYISDKLVSRSLAVITQENAFVIANNLDFDNLESYDNVINLSYTRVEGNSFEDKIRGALTHINFPSKIGLSFSTIQDILVDVLGHGSYEFLSEIISKMYLEAGKAVEFVSAEKIIYALMDRKDDAAISKMKTAAKRADEILDQAFAQIKPGMSEKDVVELVHNIFEIKPTYFEEQNIVKEEFSWNKDFCPIVLAGPSLQKGGHAMSSNQAIECGATVYFDFGVKLYFKDGTHFSSDIQRMGYVLRQNETEAPNEIEQLFKTLFNSVTIGIENLLPGKKGYEIDELVRSYIKKSGYQDYDHATGHAIGEIAHSPGTLLGPKGEGLSALDIQPNGVYTIEPRIPINNGGSIEEMVLATDDGGVPISPRQTKLYLINRDHY